MKTILLLAEGFEEIEAVSTADILRRGGVDCRLCSVNNARSVKGAHGIAIECDFCIDTVFDNAYLMFDAIILPGGMPGTKNLKNSDRVISAVKTMYDAGKICAAVCAAPSVFQKAGILEGKKITSYPGEVDIDGTFEYSEDTVVVCGNIITSRSPATTPQFAFEILRALGLSEEALRLREGMLYHTVLK